MAPSRLHGNSLQLWWRSWEQSQKKPRNPRAIMAITATRQLGLQKCKRRYILKSSLVSKSKEYLYLSPNKHFSPKGIFYEQWTGTWAMRFSENTSTTAAHAFPAALKNCWRTFSCSIWQETHLIIWKTWYSPPEYVTQTTETPHCCRCNYVTYAQKGKLRFAAFSHAQSIVRTSLQNELRLTFHGLRTQFLSTFTENWGVLSRKVAFRVLNFDCLREGLYGLFAVDTEITLELALQGGRCFLF